MIGALGEPCVRPKRRQTQGLPLERFFKPPKRRKNVYFILCQVVTFVTTMSSLFLLY